MEASGPWTIPAAKVLSLRPMPAQSWLGQRVTLLGQLTDAAGAAVPGAAVTLIATAGRLVAGTLGGDVQRGRCVTVTTDLAGLVRAELHADLPAFLPEEAERALEVGIASLGDAAAPSDAMEAVAALVDSYRAEANAPFRAGIDALFDAYRTPEEGPGLGWTLETAAVVGYLDPGDSAPMPAGLATLAYRNWLGLWRKTHAGAVAADTRLDALLASADPHAPGDDLAESVATATRGFAGLEHGKIGRQARKARIHDPVNSFLARTAAATPGADDLATLVRAAGTSTTAIASGGAATFGAMKSVQSIGQQIVAQKITKLEADVKPELETVRASLLDTGRKVDAVDQRVTTTLVDVVRKPELETVRATIADTGRKVDAVDQRVTTTLVDVVRKPELETVRATIADTSRKVDAVDQRVTTTLVDVVRKPELETVRATIADTGRKVDAVDQRVTTVLPTLHDQLAAQLSAQISTQLSKSFESRLASVATKDDLKSLDTRLSTQVTSTREDFTKIFATKEEVSKIRVVDKTIGSVVLEQGGVSHIDPKPGTAGKGPK